jgi:hypothetical protein
MMIRKFAAICLVAGAAALGSAGTAAASDIDAQSWMVFATYPATTQGWADCWNAKVNVYKGDCKLNSDTSATVDLWGWAS